MASPESPTTGPKPFVLVLMPFRKEFKDTYTFGIKGAAEDVGAYAERIDEQIFHEGILDRVFNQINKADVIVADMTGQNPNVFYEVGYAHALNKIVLLVTKDANDIPFDLKHRQHIVYSGEIQTLRAELSKRLTWAIEESQRRGQEVYDDKLAVSLFGVPIPEFSHGSAVPSIAVFDPPLNGFETRQARLNFEVRNNGVKTSEPISHLYLFGERHPNLFERRKDLAERHPELFEESHPDRERSLNAVPGEFITVTDRREPRGPAGPIGIGYISRFDMAQLDREQPVELFKDLIAFRAADDDASKLKLAWQYRLPRGLAQIPPGAVEVLTVGFKMRSGSARFCLRFHSARGVALDFPFSVSI